MDLLTAGVMNGMLSASSCMKMADVSMGVYRNAESKGDVAAMKRAMGYAADSMSSANENSQGTQESLKAAQIEAKEQEKAEQQAALEQKAQGTTETNQQTPDHSTPADTVEISDQGRKTAQANGKITVVQGTASQADTSIAGKSVDTPAAVAQNYTPQGNIQPLNINVKLSVSV